MAPQLDRSPERPWLSIVVPMKNEAENLELVTEGIAAACAGAGPFEAIYVDDGSTDGTAAKAVALVARFPFLRVIAHERSGGQSAAIHSGENRYQKALPAMKPSTKTGMAILRKRIMAEAPGVLGNAPALL